MSVMFVSLVAFNALLFNILICFRRDRSGPRVGLFCLGLRQQLPERRYHLAQSQFHA